MGILYDWPVLSTHQIELAFRVRASDIPTDELVKSLTPMQPDHFCKDAADQLGGHQNGWSGTNFGRPEMYRAAGGGLILSKHVAGHVVR